ncbi:MAG: transcriptional regulator [Haloquadratum phage sp.]|nr:MAG: transcriptional regulator [Haloquadratum phage sp.]
MVLHDLTGFQRDLLRTIERLEDPHGLGIKETLEGDYGGSVELHHGRLYPNLDTLVKKGLVEKGTKDRRTNSYTLSQRGKRELDRYRDWLAGHD